MSCFLLLLLSTAKAGDTDSVPAIIQYINPPLTIATTYYSDNSFRFTNIENSLSNNIEDRADFPVIFQCGFILIFIFIFIINNLSKLFKKGGIFGFN